MRVALVTGAVRGLGAEIARALKDAGYSVMVNSRSAHVDAQVHAIQGDVSNSSDAKRIAEYVEAHFGRLDVLVNNAAVSIDALLLKTSEEDFDRIIDTNTRGAFLMTAALAPLIARSGGGHVVNITSRSGLHGQAGHCAYAASKAALVGLTKASAIELAPMGIRVNAVAPSYMPTQMGQASPLAMEAAIQQSILKTLGNPTETASFIRWLVGTESISGQVFELDSRI